MSDRAAYMGTTGGASSADPSHRPAGNRRWSDSCMAAIPRGLSAIEHPRKEFFYLPCTQRISNRTEKESHGIHRFHQGGRRKAVPHR